MTLDLLKASSDDPERVLDTIRAYALVDRAAKAAAGLRANPVERYGLQDIAAKAIGEGNDLVIITQTLNSEKDKRGYKGKDHPDLTINDVKNFSKKVDLLIKIFRTQKYFELANRVDINDELGSLVKRINDHINEIELRIVDWDDPSFMEIWANLHKMLNNKMALLLNYLKTLADVRTKNTTNITVDDLVSKLMIVAETVVQADYLTSQQKKKLIEDVRKSINEQQEIVVQAIMDGD